MPQNCNIIGALIKCYIELYCCYFENVKFKNLSWDWNRGDLSAPDWNLMRYKANFIHYSEEDMILLKVLVNTNMLKKDLEFLYPELS